MTRRNHHRKKRTSAGARLYELEVALIGGPITESFSQANPVVSRTILIRGNQTLTKLHDAIFDAFDREEEHMYEFQVGGKGPMDTKAKRYVLPMAADDSFSDRRHAGLVTRTKVDDLNLREDETFGYWFDFGDDWWHQIDVVAIRDKVPPGTYPRVKAKTGDSPPQYMDWDEEEPEDEDEEE